MWRPSTHPIIICAAANGPRRRLLETPCAATPQAFYGTAPPRPARRAPRTAVSSPAEHPAAHQAHRRDTQFLWAAASAAHSRALSRRRAKLSPGPGARWAVAAGRSSVRRAATSSSAGCDLLHALFSRGGAGAAFLSPKPKPLAYSGACRARRSRCRCVGRGAPELSFAAGCVGARYRARLCALRDSPSALSPPPPPHAHSEPTPLGSPSSTTTDWTTPWAAVAELRLRAAS